MEDEQIEVVDRTGKRVDTITRSAVYVSGALHKAVNILVFNKKREIYLQKRSSSKSSFPSFWDISVSEHTKSKESYKQAAQRGLIEELSITSRTILIRDKHIQKSNFIKDGKVIQENELVKLFATMYDGKIKIEKAEISRGKFVNVKKLKNFFEEKKLKFTPWALDEISFFLKKEGAIFKKLHI